MRGRGAADGPVGDTDPQGQALSAVVVAAPTHGTLTLNPDGSFDYTPAANYNGSDSFTFKANDGAADSNVATFAFTVTPVNDAPVAQGQNLTTAEDTALTGNVVATDVDGDARAVAILANATLCLARTDFGRCLRAADAVK